MDAHVVRSSAEGEVEDHQGKQSVMKKMKVKAKKLKDSVTGRGHQGHEQEEDQTVDDHDLEEEDGEKVDSPEVHHGAPMYDSSVKRTDAPVQGDIRAGRDEYDPVAPREKSKVNVTDPIKSTVSGPHGDTGHGATHNYGATRTDAPGQEGMPGQNRTTTGHEDLRGGARTKLGGPTVEPVLKHEEPKGLGGGTHTPHNTPVSSVPNYDTSTMDVDQVNTAGSGKGGHLGESRLGKTDDLREETPLPQSIPASSLAHGSHKNDMDVDPKQTFVSGQGGNADQSRVNLNRPSGLEEDSDAPKATPQAYTPSNNETEVTDPTKSGGEDIGVTPMLRSFDKMNLHGDDRQHLNNGANQDKSTGSHDQFSPDKPSNQGSSYIGSATSAICSTAISAKNAVASKLGYGATESAEHDDYSRGHVTGAGKSGSSPVEHQNRVLDPSTNELRPTETPQVRGTIQPDHNTETDLKQSNQAGGTYTEKISSATSAIADKAVSAKNVVASKLGYGPSDQVRDSGDVSRTNVQSGSTQADQQGKTMTSTVAEKLMPVYGKVAGAGTAVMSKFQGGSTASTGRDTSSGDVSQARQEKGVSVKDYFVEKLRPGEEDKALSEVLSEKLKIQKPAVKEQTGESASGRPMGKVTESEEVRQRLGNTEGNDNFMVNKIEDTVGSMLGGTNKNDDEHQRGVASSGVDTSGEDRKAI